MAGRWRQFVLLLSLVAAACSLAYVKGPITIQQAIAEGQVVAWGEATGTGFHQPMIALHMTSSNGQTLEVIVPRGTRLEPCDHSFAPIITTATQSAQAQNDTVLELYGLSLDPYLRLPSAMEECHYAVSDVVNGQVDSLLEVVERSGEPTSGAQMAFWHVVTGQSLADLAAAFPRLFTPEDQAEAQVLLDEAYPPPDPLNTIVKVVGGIVGGLCGLAVIGVLAVTILELSKAQSSSRKLVPSPASVASALPSAGIASVPLPQSVATPSLIEHPKPSPTECVSVPCTPGNLSLVGISGPLTGHTICLTTECIVSRHEFGFLEIDENTLSSPHALLDVSELPYQVRDLGSRNGTFVGDTRVGSRWVDLAENILLRAGSLCFCITQQGLEVITGASEGKLYTPPQQRFALSRQAIPIHVTGSVDSQISDAHAVLRLDNGLLYVRDLNSANGVWVNGERVMEETTLRPGDRVKMGGSEFIVQMIGPSKELPEVNKGT